MREVIISKIKVDDLHEEQVLFLKEREGKRILPVVVGIPEINAIKIKMTGLEVPRPLSHDLITSIIQTLGAKVVRVLVDRLQQNTFYAKIVLLGKDNQEYWVDARPSDSIAVAVRANAPIFVEDVVLDKAGYSL